MQNCSWTSIHLTQIYPLESIAFTHASRQSVVAAACQQRQQ